MLSTINLATPAPSLKASSSWLLTPDLHKDKMTALQEREETAKELEGVSSPEVAITTCIRNSLGYEDFDEFAFNFEDYDLWEAIRNHLGYPGSEPTCKYRPEQCPHGCSCRSEPPAKVLIPHPVFAVCTLFASGWSPGLGEL